MPVETLEALRLLSNLETEKRKLVQVVRVVLSELVETRLAGERFVQSIAEDDRVRRPLGEQVLHVLGVAFQSKAIANLITSPGQAADLKPGFRLRDLEARLQLSMLEQEEKQSGTQVRLEALVERLSAQQPVSA